MQIYIHIPFCLQRCSYCDFTTEVANPNKPQDYERINNYIDMLVNSIDQSRNMFSPFYNETVSTIYIGGGTPSILDPQHIIRIDQSLRKNFLIDPNAEYTIEINPATLDDLKAKTYKHIGINRASVGMQSSNPNELKILSRVHNFEEYLQTVDILTTNGIKNISTDIMFGLPYQTLQTLEATIDSIPSTIEHVSAYSLEVYDHTPLGKKSYSYPSGELEREMYYLINSKLSEKGLYRYEISNFSKPAKHSRHNNGYWRRENYIGFGESARSLLNNKRYKYENFKFILEEELSTEDEIAETVILGLRLSEGIDLAVINEKYHVDAEKKYEKEIDKLIKKGLLIRNNSKILLTDLGFDLANLVFQEFI